jgi:predicted transcriptional regulator
MSLVKDYMNPKMVSRSSNTNVLDISKAMTEWKISSIAITDQSNHVLGILTERDVVNSIAKGVHPEKISASSLMSTPILSISNDTSIEEAAWLMVRKKVRHLLVEDPYHAFVGIITTMDLARYLKDRMKKEGKSRKESTSSDELLSEVWELFF